jgi:predicted O-methyltransferase YrrM
MKRFIKKIKPIRRFYDALMATRYFNFKYLQILKWMFTSNEETNFTYDLTDKNYLELLKTIESCLDVSFEQLQKYLDEILNDDQLKLYLIRKTKDSTFENLADQHVRFSRRVCWYVIARVIKPKVIVETGVDKGMGSVVLCAALLKNNKEGYTGRYIGTDINIEAGYLFDEKYKSVGEIIYGDSVASLEKLDQKIDLFINDSDHSANYEYREYQTIKNKLNPKALILGDNSHVTDKLLKFSIENDRMFVLFKEEPKNHWYPGAGVGISFPRLK